MVEDRRCDNCAYHCYSEEYCKTERECKRAFGDNWEDGRRSVKVEVKDNNYENTGTLVKNSRSGKIGVVLLEFPTGQVQVLESIQPFVICTYDSWGALENCEETPKEEDLFGCDTCKHEDVDIDAPPCCDCWVPGCDQWENWEPKEKEQDVINHPEHYTFGKHECIEEMERMFGKETVLHWCMCNVYKYRYRATHKNGEEDLKKADWYMDKIIEMEGWE